MNKKELEKKVADLDWLSSMVFDVTCSLEKNNDSEITKEELDLSSLYWLAVHMFSENVMKAFAL